MGFFNSVVGNIFGRGSVEGEQINEPSSIPDQGSISNPDVQEIDEKVQSVAADKLPIDELVLDENAEINKPVQLNPENEEDERIGEVAEGMEVRKKEALKKEALDDAELLRDDDIQLTSEKIAEIQNKPDNVKISPEERLTQIMTELGTMGAKDFKIEFDPFQEGGSYKVEPFFVKSTLCHKIESQFSVKFTVNGEENEVTLKRTIYTRESDSDKALANAYFYGKVCVDIAANIQGIGGDSIIDIPDDVDRQKLLKAPSFAINFLRNSDGKYTIPDSISFNNITLKFRENSFTTVDSKGIQRHREKRSIPAIFNAPYSLVTPNKYSQEFIDAAQKRIDKIKEESKKIKKEFEITNKSWNPLKRFGKTKEEVATPEYQVLLENLDVIEKGLDKKATLDESKEYAALSKEKKKHEEMQAILKDIIAKLTYNQELNSKESALKNKILAANKDKSTDVNNEAKRALILVTKFQEAKEKELAPHLAKIDLKMESIRKEIAKQNDVLIDRYFQIKKSTAELETYTKYIQHLLDNPDLGLEEAKKDGLLAVLSDLNPILSDNLAFISRVGKKLEDESLPKPIPQDAEAESNSALVSSDREIIEEGVKK